MITSLQTARSVNRADADLVTGYRCSRGLRQRFVREPETLSFSRNNRHRTLVVVNFPSVLL